MKQSNILTLDVLLPIQTPVRKNCCRFGWSAGGLLPILGLYKFFIYINSHFFVFYALCLFALLGLEHCGESQWGTYQCVLLLRKSSSELFCFRTLPARKALFIPLIKTNSGTSAGMSPVSWDLLLCSLNQTEILGYYAWVMV